MEENNLFRNKIEELLNRAVKLSEIETDKEKEYWEGQINILKVLVSFIDSLQEEPVSEDLDVDSMIEAYRKRLVSQANGVSDSPLVSMCITSYKHGIQDTLSEQKLSSLARIGKNWKEESVSEDLAKEIRVVYTTNLCVREVLYKDFEKIAHHFAEWQKQKDDRLIRDKIINSYNIGLKRMKQQMMKDAVEGEVKISGAESRGYRGDFWIESRFLTPYEAHDYIGGEKVKLIIIKED